MVPQEWSSNTELGESPEHCQMCAIPPPLETKQNTTKNTITTKQKKGGVSGARKNKSFPNEWYRDPAWKMQHLK